MSCAICNNLFSEQGKIPPPTTTDTKNEEASAEKKVKFPTAEGSQLNITSCGHIFHRTCVLDWFSKGNNSCPTCKKGLTQRQLKPIFLSTSAPSPSAASNSAPSTSTTSAPSNSSDQPSNKNSNYCPLCPHRNTHFETLKRTEAERAALKKEIQTLKTEKEFSLLSPQDQLTTLQNEEEKLREEIKDLNGALQRRDREMAELNNRHLYEQQRVNDLLEQVIRMHRDSSDHQS